MRFRTSFRFLQRTLVVWILALLNPGDGQVPPQGLRVSDLWMSSDGAWIAYENSRIVIRTPARPPAEFPTVRVRAELMGDLCGAQDREVATRLVLDGHVLESCKDCHCEIQTEIDFGPHMITAHVVDKYNRTLAMRRALIRLEADAGHQEECGLSQDQASRARQLMKEYSELHSRILDEGNHDVEKRFLVVRSSHGLSNTQIEEVTGLIMAMLTRRALIVDFTNDTYTGPRPAMEYEWGLPIWMEGLSPHYEEEHEIVDMPRIPNEEYGKYGELLGCEHWNRSMPADSHRIVLANTLFGFPTAYLNPHHASDILDTFGPYLFPTLHRFLHQPSPRVSEIVDAIQSEFLAHAACSVGLQVRWHHLRAYLPGKQHADPSATLLKFLRCAAQVCPMNRQTVLFLATDFKSIRAALKSLLPSFLELHFAASNRNLARACGTNGGVGACPAEQSSVAQQGEAWLAVDGERNGVYSSGSCTHTWDDLSGVGTDEPWWRVDLQGEKSIAAVLLFSRSDCCPERLHGAEVYIGNSPNHADNVACGKGLIVEQGGHLMVWCDGSGRFVHVVLPGKHRILSVCEVEVYEASEWALQVRHGEGPAVAHLEPLEWDDTDRIMDGGDHEAALADQRLLAACDHIVTTRESTLGWVAHASVCKPSFQVSPHEEACTFIPHSQSGLVQRRELIHDEWPWSHHKYSKLTCQPLAGPHAAPRSLDVLAEV